MACRASPVSRLTRLPAAMRAKTVTLSNGVEMPLVGLGTWQSSAEEVKRAVKTAIKAGYRMIDTASVYQNEEPIGEAIAECIKEGLVTRDELFVTTKAWTNELGPKVIEQALRNSLARLKLDKIDLYLVHMPCAFDETCTSPLKDCKVEDIWHGLEHVYDLGLARSIGVSNWNDEQIERAMKVARVPIHNSQIEVHLYFPQRKLTETCKKHKISLTSYATFGSPARVNFSLPGGQKLDWAPAASELEDKNVHKLAEKYHKSPGQILLRYALDRNMAVIPKSANDKRIAENFQLFDFSLTAEEVSLLEKHDYNQRLFVQQFAIGHPEDPFVNERN